MRRVKTKDLQEALATAALFGASHSPVDHYLFCKVKTVMGGLSLLCSSMAGVCQTKVDGEGTESFEAYVPIKRLKDVLGNISDDTISLSYTNSSLMIGTAIGSVSIAASMHVIDLPTIKEGEWIEVDAKASADELAFLGSISSVPMNDCIKVVKKRSTSCTNTAFAWVENSKLSWAEGSLLSMEAAKLLRSLLAKAENVSVLPDGGNLGVRWDSGVALIRGLDFAGKVRTVPTQFFDNAGVAICEVRRADLQHILGLCQGVSLVESVGVRLEVKDGSLRVTKQTRDTGSVDMSVPCSTYHKDYTWIVDVNAINNAVRTLGTEVICLDGVITFKEEPDVLTLAVNDGKRFVAVGSLSE